jgi:ribosomal protein L17
VFRITGDINQDYGRDLAHAGYRTHQALAEAIAPIVDEMITMAKTQRPTSTTRQLHDIIRTPQDLRHKTMNEARANLTKFDRKKNGPFIYE